MIKDFFSNPYTPAQTKKVAAQKLAAHAKSKQMISDLSGMVKQSKDQQTPLQSGIFFDAESVVIAIVADKTSFLNELAGMTSDGLREVMACAADSIAVARNLPARQKLANTLVESLPPETPETLADAELKTPTEENTEKSEEEEEEEEVE